MHEANGAEGGNRVRVVDLGSFRDELRVYAGRAWGQRARAEAELDTLDVDPAIERVVVDLHDDTWAVTTSFWIGAFGDSVRRLHAAEFRARYEFRSGISREDVEAGIADALLEEDPLGPADYPFG